MLRTRKDWIPVATMFSAMKAFRSTRPAGVFTATAVSLPANFSQVKSNLRICREVSSGRASQPGAKALAR